MSKNHSTSQPASGKPAKPYPDWRSFAGQGAHPHFCEKLLRGSF